MTERVQYGSLQIAKELDDLLVEEILPGLKVTRDEFWSSFNEIVDEFVPRNNSLISQRENLQEKIDKWHLDRKGQNHNHEEYKTFLKEIGYWVEEANDFQITTSQVDPEISEIAGPQLVVPVMNARFSLNAANARWGSLYDALYGTDMISEEGGAERGGTYNPVRGDKVIEFSKTFLNKTIPLSQGTFQEVTSFQVHEGNLEVTLSDQSKVGLKDNSKFIGYTGEPDNPSGILFKNNKLHIEIQVDREDSVGKDDAAGIKDVLIESAVTTIQDLEDSIAAVDAEDKVIAYRNWLGLMKGNLQTEVEKKGKKFTRKLNSDREYTAPDGSKIKLHGRALMLNRNVGHLMTNSSILLKDGSEIPEGIMDAFITTAAAIHDFKSKGNSRTNSVYIVKPKMHGPDEAAFTDLIFEKVENVLGLKKYTIKIGIMDEERRTTVNLKECIRAVKNRVVFINTGFLDRTGDEMHTSMEAGPMIKKGDMKSSKWISAYENNNVDVGLACGFSGIAQIGKGMWAAPDKMADMIVQKINHVKSGANCAWVPSPTAATLHALHYHQVDIFSKQKELKKRGAAKINDILSIPIADRPNWSMEEITKELENNAQGILGYVVRWVDQGVGCSKVPDINNVGLMEDRATLRISSQHIANWLHHGICSKEQVLKTMKKMAKIVDNQNIKDPALKGYPAYQTMSYNYDKSVAFKAACELVFHGRNQPSGYTEPILHLNRLLKKI